jgi:predicted transcriptional regulator
MRLTIHMPDGLGERLKSAADTERKSVSSIISEAVDHYLVHKRRKALGLKILELASEGAVEPDALEAMDEGRTDDRA